MKLSIFLWARYPNIFLSKYFYPFLVLLLLSFEVFYTNLLLHKWFANIFLLSLHFPMSFYTAGDFNFDDIQFILFLLWLCFCFYLRKLCLIQSYNGVTYVFQKVYILRSLIHYHLILVWYEIWMKVMYCIWTLNCSRIIVQKYINLSLICLCIFAKIVFL